MKAGVFLKNIFSYNTSIGRIHILDNGKEITNLFLSNNSPNYHLYSKRETDLIKKTSLQLEEYLNGNRREFTIPINPEGTDFQKRVWKSLMNIQYGELKTYKDISTIIDNPKASRAVGNAIGKNPILIIIPCHRVINSNGKLGGFSAGIQIKKELLDLEDISFKS